jgi:hypothetical protein
MSKNALVGGAALLFWCVTADVVAARDCSTYCAKQATDTYTKCMKEENAHMWECRNMRNRAQGFCLQYCREEN